MGHHHHETNTTVNNNSTTNSENVFNTVKDNTVVTNKHNEHITTLNNDSAAGGLIIAHDDANTGTAIYGLQELQTNIHTLRTSGLLNSHANRWTTTNVGHMSGDRHSVISLGELNWITDAAAKVKAAAAAAKAKAAAEAAKVKAAADAEAAKLKQAAIDAEHHVVDVVKHDIDAVKNLPAAVKAHLAEDIAKAKVAAAHLAAITKSEAAEIIHEATDMAKAEGAKLANQLIDDAEAEGHFLDDEAKAKILALSIQLGQETSDKMGEEAQGLEAVLDSHRNVFTNSIIDYVEAQGENLTVEGQERAVALAALLGQTGSDKVGQLDNKIDQILNDHRPVAVLLI